ncbi:hypothetical protein [Desulfovibrio sp. TomC]|uniref:hypothetical protein n=1 Tax=Desulfovibrio sp. TomC TaxID=1562888 RepID=UPI0012E15974|nr:hypothetical protein [Desulfovibrio sp. TomC]
MSITNTILAEIKVEIDKLETSDLGIVYLQKLSDGGKFAELLHQPVDVTEEPVLASDIFLGSYTNMHSPGIISLYKTNIKDFFWELVRRCLTLGVSYITKEDLQRISNFVVFKTYYHEIFHFNCDVQCHLWGYRRDHLREEALAVAYSRLRIYDLRNNANSTIGRTNGVLFNTAFKEAYRYTSPGYRDWVSFPDWITLRQEILEYFCPAGASMLRSNGIDVEGMLLGMFIDDHGFLERLCP